MSQAQEEEPLMEEFDFVNPVGAPASLGVTAPVQNSEPAFPGTQRFNLDSSRSNVPQLQLPTPVDSARGPPRAQFPFQVAPAVPQQPLPEAREREVTTNTSMNFFDQKLLKKMRKELNVRQVAAEFSVAGAASATRSSEPVELGIGEGFVQARVQALEMLKEFAENAAAKIMGQTDPGCQAIAAEMIVKQVLSQGTTILEAETSLDAHIETRRNKFKPTSRSSGGTSDGSSEDLFGEKKKDPKMYHSSGAKLPFVSKTDGRMQKFMLSSYGKDFSNQNYKSFQGLMQTQGCALPIFPPGDQCRLKPELWEDFWEQLEGYIIFSGANRDHVAWLLKTTAKPHSNVADALYDLRMDDGTLLNSTYDSIRETLRKICGPRGNALTVESKRRVDSWARRMGERI